jgi:hypothetical protein
VFGADYNNNLLGAQPPGNVTPYFERALIQFAGFTVGQAASFFDFGGWYNTIATSMVAWNWNPVFAYTATFGQGVSLTLSVEDGQSHRTKLTTGTYGGVASTANAYGGQIWPNLIANVRVDQVWGSAQISGAIQQLRVNQATSATINDSWGYALLAGIEVKLGMLAPGSSIALQGVYSRGAVEFTGLSASPLASTNGIGLKNPAGVGPASDIFDGYYNAGAFGATIQRSVAYSIFGTFRHFFQPNLWGAIWAGYLFYNPGGLSTTAAGADPNLRVWQAGAKILYSPRAGLDISLDGMWSRVSTGTCTGAAAGVQIANCNIGRDIGTIWNRWTFTF